MAPIRSLVTPGGFTNHVGQYVAALDVGLAHVKDAARKQGAGEATCEVLRAYGDIESAWVHQAVGRVPTPPPPEDAADLEAWIGWLDAIRTVSIMVLRPKEDRELETLVEVPGDSGGPRTLKRLLAELLFLQGRECGRL
jgi:hypothetical protein